MYANGIPRNESFSSMVQMVSALYGGGCTRERAPLLSLENT